MAKITRGGIEFKKKGDLYKRIREIKDRIPEPRTLYGEEFDIMMGVVENYYDRDWLVGCGVKEIRTGWHDVPGHSKHLNFWVVRVDGSLAQFKYKELPKTKKTIINELFRSAISDQIVCFKNSYIEKYGCVCQISGKPGPEADFQVHHTEPEFKDLVLGFLRSVDLKPEDIEFSEFKDAGQSRRIFKNMVLYMKWCGYHKINASVQFILKTEHDKITYKKRN